MRIGGAQRGIRATEQTVISKGQPKLAKKFVVSMPRV